MKKASYLIFVLGLTLFFSCKSEQKELTIDELLQTRYSKLLEYELDSLAFPRSYSHDKNKIKKVPSKDWTSGFFPGNLWQIYKLTGNEPYKKRAEQWTAFVEKEKFNAGTHDMGFKVFCSFGNGLSIEKDNETYKNVIIKSAQTLSSRFNEKIGSIRSWDFKRDVWQFPVIIDNMMNLELLFEATKISGDSTFHKIAVTHANTTLKNHFRPDGSTWHVLDYDTISAQVRAKVTHQGIHDNSAWARGQGWAIYGYTMAYRHTKDAVYLERAKATADFFINHKNLPEDGIPYWDFDNPKIPNTSRDASAGAIVASALVELYGYTKNDEYLNYSKKVAN
ncbi:glycoside hydrolase family 88 protein, partial [Algibacter sp.]|uniref:glycoside hydrolase family 88 protein n=1 Tax=Algibacter sp. TaxID=1872428 RepID=UPI003C724415